MVEKVGIRERNETPFEFVDIAGPHRLGAGDVVRERHRVAKRPRESIRSIRAQDIREGMDVLHKHVNCGGAVEGLNFPRRPAIAPLGEIPSATPQHLGDAASFRRAAEHAPECRGRVPETLLHPAGERNREQLLGLGVWQHRERWIDPRFHRSLGEHVAAEAVDGANAGFLQVRESAFEGFFLGGCSGVLPCVFERTPEPQLQLTGGPRGERDNDNGVHRGSARPEDGHDAVDDLRRFPGTRRRFDEEAMAKVRPDTVPGCLIDRRRHHASPRRRMSAPSASWVFSAMRVSSYGPQTR